MSEAKLSALGTGSTVKGIVLDDLKRLSIYLPESLREQAVIAKALDDAADEVAALANNITKLRTEKKALMQPLLTGKRRVVV
jgi:type I restriction enzyme S subunit